MSGISVEEWLANLPSNIQAIVRELRSLAKKNMVATGGDELPDVVIGD